jgi:GNAT superfamily N-acetyltransferase
VSRRHEPRPPTEGEWPLLRAAINRVFRPGGGDLAAELPRFLHPRNFANLRVVVETGAAEPPELDPGSLQPRLLAHAGFLPRLTSIHGRKVRVACIGAVFVVPEMRGQGLGSLVLEEVLRLARRDADLVMASGDRGLYLRQGLRPVAPLVRFEPPKATPDSAAPQKIRTREATADDIDRLIAMHDTLDVRFARSASDWRRWLAARPLLFLGAPARLDLVERPPESEAAAKRPAERPRAAYRVTALSRRTIVEYAGDPAAVLDSALASQDALWVPPHDREMRAQASGRGWISAPRPFPMTAEAHIPNLTTVPWYGLDYL